MLIIRLSSIFNPLKVFAPMSAFLFFLAAIWAIRTLSFDKGLSPAVAMLFMGGVFVFMFGLLADQIAQTRLTLGRMDKRLTRGMNKVND